MNLDAGTFLLQWAAGGLAFLWVTTRRRSVSLGYGWLLRGVYGALAIGGLVLELRSDHSGVGLSVFVVGSVLLLLSVALALLVSVLRRGAGVRAQRADRARRAERVAAMVDGTDGADGSGASGADPEPSPVREFPPALDVPAPVFGAVALLGASAFAGGPFWLAASRFLVGAAFLGVITDAMLLGHWYLTQPGLSREPLKELVRWSAITWPFEIVVLCLPIGMISVLDGSISDGYGGLLGWMWVVSAVTTIGLIGVTWLALRERYYSAVMAATGLLYLAILTAFGTDLVARALLAP